MPYTADFAIRSFENIVRDGRFQAPTGGLTIGAPIVVDGANEGKVALAGDGDAPTALSGVCVYEAIQYKGFDQDTVVPEDVDTAPGGEYVQIVHGPGVKVKLGGALVAADLATVDVGDTLGPDGSGAWDKVVADGWVTVESVNASAGWVEARFTF